MYYELFFHTSLQKMNVYVFIYLKNPLELEKKIGNMPRQMIFVYMLVIQIKLFRILLEELLLILLFKYFMQ